MLRANSYISIYDKKQRYWEVTDSKLGCEATLISNLKSKAAKKLVYYLIRSNSTENELFLIRNKAAEDQLGWSAKLLRTNYAGNATNYTENRVLHSFNFSDVWHIGLGDFWTFTSNSVVSCWKPTWLRSNSNNEQH